MVSTGIVIADTGEMIEQPPQPDVPRPLEPLKLPQPVTTPSPPGEMPATPGPEIQPVPPPTDPAPPTI